MSINQNERHPAILLVVLLLIAFGASLVFQSIAMVIGVMILGIPQSEIMSLMDMESGNDGLRYMLLFVQGFTQLCSFILVPILYVKYYEKVDFSDKFSIDINEKSLLPSLLTVVLIIVLMVVNSPIIEWNMNVEFPGALHAFAKSLEDAAAKATQFLTEFNSFGDLILVLIVIAVIAAIGEELLFRGLIQNYVFKMSNNAHVAVWITAILFSAIHMQFFGFVPRLLLGAVFGYLMVYSGNNIWYPILGHFVNNGFTVLMMYLHQKEAISYDIENTESFPLETVGIFTIIGIVLFVLYKRHFEKEKQTL